MTFEPLIPASLWLALAVASALLLGFYALRRPEMLSRARWAGVVALMAVAVGLALLILLNPIYVRQIPPPPGKPLLTVLVDASASMATPDAGHSDTVVVDPLDATRTTMLMGNQSTRYGRAVAVGAELARQLGDQFDIRVRSFSGSTTAADSGDLAAHRPDGMITDIAAALADNLADDRPQGQAIVLLSDGIQNVGGGADPVREAVRRAKSLDVPVYTQTFGGSANTIDLAVSLPAAQDLASVGQRVPVNVDVTQIGATGAHAKVSLLYNGKEVDRQDVVMAGMTAKVRFTATQEKVGLYPYEVRVEPMPGERTDANNSATFLLRVIDQPIRILALEGKPYWDSKFLVRTLASVPAVELDSIVRVADGRFMQRTVSRRPASAATPSAQPATQPVADHAQSGAGAPLQPVVDQAQPTAAVPIPAAEDEKWQILANAGDILSTPALLRKYQIVVLGRDSEVFLNEDTLTNLQNWILQDGGSLVCCRGEPVTQMNQRLARLLPVKWTASPEARFRMRLTDKGRGMHWFGGGGSDDDTALVGLPMLASTSLAERSKPLAVVLATSVSPGGGESPAVIYQPYGTGRAVVIEGAGMWRWAFLPPQFQAREGVYSELWHSLLIWLTSGDRLLPGQKMTLSAERVRFSTVESAAATLRVRDEGAKLANPTVELSGPSLPQPQTVTAIPLGHEPGVYRVNFGKLPEGRFQARIVGATADDMAARTVFDVRPVSNEQLYLDVRPDLMATIATDSGGIVLGQTPADQLAKAFREHIQRSRPPRFERTTAWDRPWALLAVFTIWSFSWLLRRSGGLV